MAEDIQVRTSPGRAHLYRSRQRDKQGPEDHKLEEDPSGYWAQ